MKQPVPNNQNQQPQRRKRQVVAIRELKLKFTEK